MDWSETGLSEWQSWETFDVKPEDAIEWDRYGISAREASGLEEKGITHNHFYRMASAGIPENRILSYVKNTRSFKPDEIEELIIYGGYTESELESLALEVNADIETEFNRQRSGAVQEDYKEKPRQRACADYRLGTDILEFIKKHNLNEMDVVDTLYENHFEDVMTTISQFSPDEENYVVFGEYELDRIWVENYRLGEILEDATPATWGYLEDNIEGTLHGTSEVSSGIGYGTCIGVVMPNSIALEHLENLVESN